VTSSDAVSLDPNDFPALGSNPTTNQTGSSTSGGTGNGQSYASQAGTGGSGAVGSSGSTGVTGTGNANQPRDFTADDFPALGGQSQSQNQTASTQNPNSAQENHSHPPGLNGFQHTDHPQHQHRQNLLGALGGSIPPGTPGMLNLAGTQSRNVHPGFQQGPGDEKQQQLQRVSLTFYFASFSDVVNSRPSRITMLSS
jgi:CCR4-NOT transcription complex subunit 2